MKKIEIVTSHNITIVYTLATAMQRLMASAIDLGIVGMYALLITIGTGGVSLFFYVLVFPVLMFYHFLFEFYNNGQSIGKMILGLKVVTLNGRSPSPIDLFLRWIFRTIDVTLSIGTIAFLFISSSSKNQRIGDILAETSVINLKSNLFVDLQSLEKLSHKDENILFPAVTQYSDTDMLLVKDALERVNRFPNPKNKKFIYDLEQRLEKDLNLKNVELSSTAFLKQILSDYIRLTR